MNAQLRNACRILVEKVQGKRPLRRPSYRLIFKANSKLVLRETEYESVGWM
jgi:hypothetical protein